VDEEILSSCACFPVIFDSISVYLHLLFPRATPSGILSGWKPPKREMDEALSGVILCVLVHYGVFGNGPKLPTFLMS
jgi:hypothetical protein